MVRLLLLAGALICALHSSHARGDAPLKIGFIAGLSGPGKAYGEACRNGALLALADVPPGRLDVVFEDDQFIPAKTAAAFKKLTEIDGAKLILVAGSSSAMAIAPLAEEKRIPVIAWASDVRVAKERKYVLRSWVSGDAEGARLAAEAQRRATGNVAFLTTVSDYNRSVRDGFVHHYQGRIVLEDEYPYDAQDFHPFLMRAKERGTRAIGMCMNPGQPSLAARQARELGLQTPFFSCENVHDMAEVSASQGALNGTWFVTGDVKGWFSKRYREAYGNENVISGAAVNFDTVRLLADIAAAAPGNPEEIMNALRAAASAGGALGTWKVRTEGGDQYFDIALTVKTITPSGFEVEHR